MKNMLIVIKLLQRPVGGEQRIGISKQAKG
jgi:hypothetical protein